MDYYGYAGSILHVDLESREVKKEALDPQLMEDFLGGWGINWHLMAENLKPDTPPLSSQNPIVIGAGVFNGTPIPTSGKFQMATKMANPANEEMNKYTVAAGSSGSKRFPNMLKKAGYDQVVIKGKPSTPKYLWIDDAKIGGITPDELIFNGRCVL